MLDYGAGGFQGDPPVLSEMQALVERVTADVAVEEVTAASLLAQRSATSDEIVARLIKLGTHQRRKVL